MYKKIILAIYNHFKKDFWNALSFTLLSLSSAVPNRIFFGVDRFYVSLSLVAISVLIYLNHNLLRNIRGNIKSINTIGAINTLIKEQKKQNNVAIQSLFKERFKFSLDVIDIKLIVNNTNVLSLIEHYKKCHTFMSIKNKKFTPTRDISLKAGLITQKVLYFIFATLSFLCSTDRAVDFLTGFNVSYEDLVSLILSVFFFLLTINSLSKIFAYASAIKLTEVKL